MTSQMLSVFALLSAVMIHEAGHITAAVAVGAEIKRIYPILGGFRIELSTVEKLSYKKELLIISGGIIFNLLSSMMPIETAFRDYSLGAAIFNLLPIKGFDGCGIVYTLMLMIFSPKAAEKIRDMISFLTVTAVWIFAVYLSLCGRGGVPILIFTLYILIFSVKKI